MTAKILYFDIETAPNVGYTWGMWEQNVIEFTEEWKMLCFCYMWEHEGKVHKVAPDYTAKGWKYQDDLAVVKELWKLLDEADIVIAHNGDRFDIRKANARFVQLGLGAPTPYVSIDTKKLASRYFMFNSNSLNNLGQHLGLGEKVKHDGFEMWLGCMAGVKKWWDLMLKYNVQDVALLQKVYYALRPFMKNHPSVLTSDDPDIACTTCGAVHYQKRGVKRTNAGIEYQQYQCENGHYFRLRKRSGRNGDVVSS